MLNKHFTPNWGSWLSKLMRFVTVLSLFLLNSDWEVLLLPEQVGPGTSRWVGTEPDASQTDTTCCAQTHCL